MGYRRGSVAHSSDLPDLARRVDQELENVEKAFSGTVELSMLYVAPVKPRDGLTVLADGTDWNPGAGIGVYTYYAAAWHKLG